MDNNNDPLEHPSNLSTIYGTTYCIVLRCILPVLTIIFKINYLKKNIIRFLFVVSIKSIKQKILDFITLLKAIYD